MAIDNLLQQAQTKKTELTGGVVTNPVNQTTVKINGQDIKLDDIKSEADLANLTLAEAKLITKENAIIILDACGFKYDNVNAYKMSTNPAILQLLSKAEVDVRCAHNNMVTDKWITGRISNVNVDADNLLSYDIDCKGVTGATFEYKYSFKQKQTTDNSKVFNLTEIDKNGSDDEGYILNT